MTGISLDQLRPAPFRVWDLPLDEHSGGRETVVINIDPTGKRRTACLSKATDCSKLWIGESHLPSENVVMYFNNVQDSAESLYVPPDTAVVGWADSKTTYPIDNDNPYSLFVRNIDYYKDPNMGMLKNADKKWTAWLPKPLSFQNHIITKCCMDKRYGNQKDLDCHLGRGNGVSRAISRGECDILVKEWCESPSNITKPGCECYNISSSERAKAISVLKQKLPQIQTFYPVQYIPKCKTSPAAYWDLHNQTFSTKATVINNILNCNITQDIGDTEVEIGDSTDSAAQAASCNLIGQDGKGNKLPEDLIREVITDQNKLTEELQQKEIKNRSKDLDDITKATKGSSDLFQNVDDKQKIVLIGLGLFIVFIFLIGFAIAVGGGREHNFSVPLHSYGKPVSFL